MTRSKVITVFPALVLATMAFGAADTVRLDADRAVELALQNNLAIKQARARLEEVAGARGAALGALLPQVTASGGYARLGVINRFEMARPIYDNVPFPVINPVTGDTIGFTSPIPIVVGATIETLQLGSQNNFSLRGTVQQTLFTWGKLVNACRIAGFALDMEKEALRRAESQVKVQAVEGFYNVLLARKMASLMQESYAQLERHAGQVQALYDNGLAKKLDVMRAQVGLVNMRAQLSRVTSGAELAEAALRSTLGLAPETSFALNDELETEGWNVDIGAATDSALAHRPELVQLRTATRIADLGVRIARTANLPNAFAQFNYEYKRPVGFADVWGTDWNLTAGVSMPIFSGLSNLNKLKQAEAKRRQVRVALAMVEDAVRLEVKALHTALEQEKANIDYQAENAKVAEQALEMAETSYRNGLVTNLEYLDAQLALTQSRVSYLGSQANYKIARAKLRQAMATF